jgi:hypothetical protein
MNGIQRSPDGRAVHFWRGEDPKQDTAELRDTIAEAIPSLCTRGDSIIAKVEKDGSLSQINWLGFCALVEANVCYKRIVPNGSGWKAEYLPYAFGPRVKFDPTKSGPRPPPDNSRPYEEHFKEIYNSLLVKRLPRIVE